jgi:hypothetical protein
VVRTRPAPLRVAVPLFAASSALFFMAFYVVLPVLRRAGFSWFATFNLVLALPTALLGVAAIGAGRLEGSPLKWLALRERLRLAAPDSATWLWTLALSAFMYRPVGQRPHPRGSSAGHRRRGIQRSTPRLGSKSSGWGRSSASVGSWGRPVPG